MPTDQKLSELPLAGSIGNADTCLLVSNGADYQLTMALLLQFVAGSLCTGAAISFGSVLPQNTTGKNGDVFVNTASGSMAQKIAGVWMVTYTPAAPAAQGNTVLYGLGAPLAAAGNNGDTYINTAAGIFYQKANGSWAQVFSMQSGPAGSPGLKGDTGAAGANGTGILNGTTDPSNQLTGNNGDFYLNTNTYALFGPKTGGSWGAGVSLVQSTPAPAVIDIPAGSVSPVVISNYPLYYQNYGSYPALLVQEVISSNTARERTDIQPLRIFSNGALTGISLDVPGDAGRKTTTHLQLIIKP